MMDSLLNGILKVLSRGRVTIFAFHKVPLEKDPLRPDELNLSEFVRLLDVIQSCFDIVPLSHALQNVQNNTSVRRMGCLTFDDGYSDWMDGVVPLLRERNLHATFFIATQQLIGNAIWNERIRHAVQCMPSSELGRSLAEAELASASEMADRIRILSYFEKKFKYLTLEERADRLDRLECQAGVDPRNIKKFTCENLGDLHQYGFGIGAHTMAHPILSLCPDAQARGEIVGSKELLEDCLKMPISLFAYPNGHKGVDYQAKHVEMVRQLGFDAGLCTDWGAFSDQSSLFELPRFTPWGGTAWLIKCQLIRNLLRN